MMRIARNRLVMAAWLTATGVFGAMAAPADGAVTVESWWLSTQAGDFVDGPGEAEAVDNTVALPFHFTREVQSGASRSTSSYSFDVAMAEAIFHFDFDHVRDGDGPPGGIGRGDFAYSDGTLSFSLSEPMFYQIEGQYLLDGIPNGMSLFISLLRQPTQTVVFLSEQSGAGVTDQRFDVGGLDGTNFNNLSGNPSGVLTPGTYLFSYQYTIRAAVSDSGASATGWLSFGIVPEPTMVLLLCAAALLLLRRGPSLGRSV
jgi:hypothetical protein